MKRITVFLLFVISVNLFVGCVVCNNFVEWRYTSTDIYCDTIPIVPTITLERCAKDISPFSCIMISWVWKLSGYNLIFNVKDNYQQYLNIDSIKFTIYTNDSIIILDSILTARDDSLRNNCFITMWGKTINNTIYWNSAYMKNKYHLEKLERYKENFFIDFTLYLKNKNSEQKILTYSHYELKYRRCSGIYMGL